MTTYQLQINERLPLGKSIIALLKSTPDVALLRKITDKTVAKEEDTELYKRLDCAFKDVKLMMDGKKREKTLDELIYELCNSND